MNGKISQWKDDKGFGFITSDDGQKIFFHISSLTTRDRRPEIGDLVIFTAQTDKQNRLKASKVAIEGLSKTSQYQRHNKVEPKTKNGFDYLLMFALSTLALLAAYTYFKLNSIEDAIVFAIPAVVALILLGRQKKPKSRVFNCTKCKKVEHFDKRTISAWNRGFTRLYCNTCHVEWLRNNPSQENNYSSSQQSKGCLVAFTLIVGTSSFAGYSLVSWLVQVVI